MGRHCHCCRGQLFFAAFAGGTVGAAVYPSASADGNHQGGEPEFISLNFWTEGTKATVLLAQSLLVVHQGVSQPTQLGGLPEAPESEGARLLMGGRCWASGGPC
jgi:hypothetical protein